MQQTEQISGTLKLDDGREIRLENAFLAFAHRIQEHPEYGQQFTHTDMEISCHLEPKHAMGLNRVPCAEFGKHVA